MNSKVSNFIKNFSYTLSSNLVSLIISTMVVLIVPKLIGKVEYGYFQLYIFYSAYVGFLHFGWNDGIYLRYGGKEYSDLDKKVFFSQFYMLMIMQVIIGLGISIVSCVLFSDVNRVFILLMTATCMLIVNLRFMLLYILQCTNEIKAYSRITIMDRILYCVILAAFLFSGFRNYQLLVVSDIIGKFISLLYAMYCCRDIVFHKISDFYMNFKEASDNIRAGSKLMFANIASMLIIGIVRLGIENTWDISTFGKVSLTLSVSNLMMIFINAVGIIMFPILRRTDERKLPGIYVTMRDFLMSVLMGILIFYYPLRVFLSAWLPQYAESLAYMALVFPMCVYEGKMALLINTYLKTLRQEKLILRVNVISVILSGMLSLVTIYLMKNLTLAVISIVVLLAFRCAFAEILLSRIINIKVIKDVILELLMTIAFILTGWFIDSWIAVAGYAAAYGIYLLIKRKDFQRTWLNMTLLLKSGNIIES